MLQCTIEFIDCEGNPHAYQGLSNRAAAGMRLFDSVIGVMAKRPSNVLFLCKGNSVRSIMAEGILNYAGAGKFRAYSAGTQPKGQVNSEAIRLLQSLGHDTRACRSKSWSEFAALGAPHLDFVFTVSDSAAAETCPMWPSRPITAHWGVPNPAEAKGTPAEIALAFEDVYQLLHQRIAAFTALPLRSLDELTLRSKLREIGRMEDKTAKEAELG